MKVFVIFLINTLMKIKRSPTCKYEFKKKLTFFSHSKLKFQPRT